MIAPSTQTITRTGRKSVTHRSNSSLYGGSHLRDVLLNYATLIKMPTFG